MGEEGRFAPRAVICDGIYGNDISRCEMSSRFLCLQGRSLVNAYMTRFGFGTEDPSPWMDSQVATFTTFARPRPDLVSRYPLPSYPL